MAITLLRRNGMTTLDPWRVMEDFERRMGDWTSTPFGFTPLNRLLGETQSYVPPVDLYETANDVLIAASLPGIDPAQLDIQVENGAVTISGHQQPFFTPEQSQQVKQHLAGIPRYGQFSFTLKLPVEVNGAAAEAQYQDGVLKVRFPKPEAAKPVRIAVNGISGAPHVPTVESAPAEPAQIEAAQNGGKKKTAK